MVSGEDNREKSIVETQKDVIVKSNWKIWIGAMISITGIAFILISNTILSILGAGWQFREVAWNVTFWLNGGILIFLLEFWIFLYCKRRAHQGKTNGLLKGISFVISIFLLLFIVVLWFLFQIDTAKETKMENGNLLVEQVYLMGDNYYYVAEPRYGIFKYYLYDSDENGNYIEQSMDTYSGGLDKAERVPDIYHR